MIALLALVLAVAPTILALCLYRMWRHRERLEREKR